MTDDLHTTYTAAEAAEQLEVPADDLRAYVAEGLVEPAGGADAPRFTRAHMRRLWSIVTLHRDLGINLAGVAAVLQLREQFEVVRQDLQLLVEIVERELGPDCWDRLWPEGRPRPTVETEAGTGPGAAPGEGAEPATDEDGAPPAAEDGS
jgi:MerR family transcriptional regulator/heat shock protein HspR